MWVVGEDVVVLKLIKREVVAGVKKDMENCSVYIVVDWGIWKIDIQTNMSISIYIFIPNCST